MTGLVKKTIAIFALVVPFALVGCGSGEAEVDANVPVSKELKPGDPAPTKLDAAGGGGAGAPQTPGNE
jgi:hypothetical protein